MKKEQLAKLETAINIKSRNSDYLDDYLYDQNNKQHQKSKKFDSLDIIFIIGDPLLLPWQQKAKNVLNITT